MTLVIGRKFGIEIYTKETDEHFCCVLEPDFQCDTRLNMAYEEYVKRCSEDPRLYCIQNTYNNTSHYGNPMFSCLGLMMHSIVPSSGALSISGLAKEKDKDDYNHSSAPTTPYSLTDLAVGGNSNGNGFSVESTNTNNCSSDRPDSSTPHAMSEWYYYDHDKPNSTITFSTSSSVGNADSTSWSSFTAYSQITNGVAACLCCNNSSHSAIAMRHSSMGTMPPYKYNWSTGGTHFFTLTGLQVNWNGVGSSNQGFYYYWLDMRIGHDATGTNSPISCSILAASGYS